MCYVSIECEPTTGSGGLESRRRASGGESESLLSIFIQKRVKVKDLSDCFPMYPRQTASRIRDRLSVPESTPAYI